MLIYCNVLAFKVLVVKMKEIKECCMNEINQKFIGCEMDGVPIFQCTFCGNLFAGNELPRTDYDEED
jgi:hypothetical protein